MNGYLWHVEFVDPYDPILVDRTGTLTVATTDPETLSVYISNDLDKEFQFHVLIHELGHCALFSFGLLDDIHRVVYPPNWVEAEEWVCNFMADYGMTIFSIAYRVMGDRAIDIIPYEIERMIA